MDLALGGWSSSLDSVLLSVDSGAGEFPPSPLPWGRHPRGHWNVESGPTPGPQLRTSPQGLCSSEGPCAQPAGRCRPDTRLAGATAPDVAKPMTGGKAIFFVCRKAPKCVWPCRRGACVCARVSVHIPNKHPDSRAPREVHHTLSQDRSQGGKALLGLSFPSCPRGRWPQHSAR